MKNYRVKCIYGTNKNIRVRVPGSKSITNRALLVAAVASGTSVIKNALFSRDSEDLINCLRILGIEIKADSEKKEITVKGCGGSIPNKRAKINVGSAGTAARFITALLAVSGGEYELDASEQMKKRPMKPLLDALINSGVKIIYHGEEGHFPFYMDSRGFKGNKITIDIGVSSQFLSGLLMAGPLRKGGLTIELTGTRKSLPYVEMTASVMESFGVKAINSSENEWSVPEASYMACDYPVEPDISAACYFYAAAEILGTRALVEGVHSDSMQGDIKFLSVLRELGAEIKDGPEGIEVTGPVNGEFKGGTFDLNDFSDQALTLAAVSAFAKSPVRITGIGHIRAQECDRINAIVTNMKALNVPVTEGEDFVVIGGEDPDSVNESDKFNHNVIINSFNDHRVAMSFAIAGLRKKGIIIDNPDCSAKTFADFFDILDEITGE